MKKILMNSVFCLAFAFLALSAFGQSAAEWNAFKRANGIDPRYTYDAWVKAGYPRGGGSGSSNSSAAQTLAQQAAQQRAAFDQAMAERAQQDAEAAAAVDKAAVAKAERDAAASAALTEARAEQARQDAEAAAAGAKAAKETHDADMARQFEHSKNELVSQLKGLSQGGDFNSDTGLKGVDNTSADSSGRKKMPDSGLKDAVADNTGDKKPFAAKNAIQDALTTSAYGQVGIDKLAGYLPNAAFNPELEGALEQAKMETEKRFDTRAADLGQFDTIVITGNSGTEAQSPAQLIPVPDSLKTDPRYQKLVIERDALQHQDQELGKQIQSIKAAPAYAQDSKSLTEIDHLQTAQTGVHGMAGYLNHITKDVVEKTITIDSVDFSDSPPPSKKGLDSTYVPPPPQ